MLRTREANKADLIEIMELEEEFKTDLFFRSEIKDIEKCIDSKCSLILFDPISDKIYAYVLAYYTEYGTAYLEKVFVHPKQRGKGFQKRLIKDVLLMLSHLGEPSNNGLHLKICYTMVHPMNHISLSNFEECGFIEKWRTEYKGQQRIILAYEVNS